MWQVSAVIWAPEGLAALQGADNDNLFWTELQERATKVSWWAALQYKEWAARPGDASQDTTNNKLL